MTLGPAQVQRAQLIRREENVTHDTTAIAARAALDRASDCQLVDVREFSEYEAERVQGATLVSLSELDQNLELIDRDPRFISFADPANALPRRRSV